MNNVNAVILAAGDGTRMKSDVPKVLHRLFGKPLLGHVMQTLSRAGITQPYVVCGYRSELVEEYVGGNGICCRQEERLGTADAVWQVRNEPKLQEKDSHLIVICGDTPLITEATLRTLMERHFSQANDCTFLTAVTSNPIGYGRISRNPNQQVVRIVEDQDADVYERAIEEINAGLYVFRCDELFSAIENIKPENSKKEYYLTDVIEIFHRKGLKIGTVESTVPEEITGINSRQGLARAYDVLRYRVLDRLMESGVTVLDPGSTHIADDVEISRDTTIYPFTMIENDVVIGAGCSIGPFCHIRPGCRIGPNTAIGNFAEINRTVIGPGSRVKHQSYLGDTELGAGVNIGAGAIVANYDGKKKHRTLIGEKAFIGSGSIIVAPARIGRSAMTGAGAVVTKNRDVPENTVVVGIPAKELRKKEEGENAG